jgi:hypothetical protein
MSEQLDKAKNIRRDLLSVFEHNARDYVLTPQCIRHIVTFMENGISRLITSDADDKQIADARETFGWFIREMISEAVADPNDMKVLRETSYFNTISKANNGNASLSPFS